LIVAALAQFSCRPHQDRLTFEAKVSDLRHPGNSLAKGKRPDDIVEVTLPGELRRPSTRLPVVSRSDADWSTPERAAASSVSAHLAGNVSWIAENYVPAEREEVRKQFSDLVVAERTRDYYRSMGQVEMTGWAEIRGFTVVLLLGRDEDGDATFASVTLSNTGSGWRETNALAEDDTYEVLWTALHTGGVR
jgi:hypothetical protein